LHDPERGGLNNKALRSLRELGFYFSIVDCKHVCGSSEKIKAPMLRIEAS
jgi:hypothetical protein